MGMVMCLPSSKEIRVIIDSSPSIHDMIPDFRSGASSTSRPPKVCPASSIDRAGHASSPVAGSSAYTTALPAPEVGSQPDRKSTRLNSSHVAISYAVFCLKKKIRNARLHTDHNVAVCVFRLIERVEHG